MLGIQIELNDFLNLIHPSIATKIFFCLNFLIWFNKDFKYLFSNFLLTLKIIWEGFNILILCKIRSTKFFLKENLI